MPYSINFDSVAPFYDRLSKWVFGNKIKSAQIDSLSFIPSGSKILIVGGGTGWILEEISKIHPLGLMITYIDNSSKMIQLSKKRSLAFNDVEFINELIENVKLDLKMYDVILTPFLLDCLVQNELEAVFRKMENSLKHNGIWIDVDFYLTTNSNLWHKILIRLMYLFFKITCNVQSSRLPNTKNYFAEFECLNQKIFCNNFILRQVFRKY